MLKSAQRKLLPLRKTANSVSPHFMTIQKTASKTKKVKLVQPEFFPGSVAEPKLLEI
jgi:hypothetical protein